MTCAFTQTGLRIAATICISGAAIGLGCASAPPPPFSAPVSEVSEPNTLVFSSQPVRNWHASNAGEPGVGLIPADRYEFSRNDARLTPLSRGPLLATQQWPEPPRPLERPVRFHRWQQH